MHYVYCSHLKNFRKHIIRNISGIMKSRFNVSLKRQPSHPLVVEIWKCWFDVLAAAFWNKKLRNSAEKSKLTALNNALKTQALTREGFACALAIYLWAVLYFQKFISSIIEVSHPRNFQYTQLYNHVHALTGTITCTSIFEVLVTHLEKDI